MGNTASNKVPDAASGAYSPTPREETVYGEYFHHPPPSSRSYSSSGTYAPSPLGTTSSSVTPPVPPRATTGLERRSMTVVARERPSDSPRPHTTRRLSTSDVTTSSSTSSTSTSTATTSATDQSVTDDLQNHIMLNAPKKGEVDVPLGSSITVHFDKDVKTVNINKLFEVHCNSVDPSLNPVKGRISYDARQQRAEFIPQNTLYPNSKYTVYLMGRAVTTVQCPHSANIKNAELHFQTCNPAPKNIGIRLKGQSELPDTIQIANYYDLYNSLIVWSTRKWGCSGEHITGMYIENEDGKLVPLKADHDVLSLKESQVVVVEIKD